MPIALPGLMPGLMLGLAVAVQPAQGQTNPRIVAVSPQAQQAIDGQGGYVPDGDWRLTLSPGGCAVRRDFVQDGARVTLVMRRLQPGLPVQYTLIGSDFSVAEPVEAGFVPGNGLARFTRLAAARAGERDGFAFAGDPFPQTEGITLDESLLAARARNFVMQGEESAPLVLRTGPANLPLNTLAECAMAGLASLGVDTGAAGRPARRASLLNSDAVEAWMRANYPGSAVRDGRQGPVTLRIIVGPDGRATHCHMASQLTARSLRETACRAYSEIAEYAPALNADGQPMTGTFLTRAVFFITPMPGM